MAFCKNTCEKEDGLPIHKIPTYRYEELVAKEEELRLLKNALFHLDSYVLNDLKVTFGITKGE